MAPRSKSGTQARQKVRLRRQIGVFDGKNVANLARQTKEAFDSLLAALNGDAGALEALGIVDGNAVPKFRLPERPELEFAGDGVVMTTTSGRYVATIAGATGVTDHGDLTGLADNDHTQYANAAAGLDGVASTLVGQTITTRRDQTTISLSTSGVFNDWSPGGGWRTTRVFLFNPTGFTQVNGFDAPSGADDTLERECWNTSTSTEFDIAHDSGSNSSVTSRVLCPDNLGFKVRPHAGWWMRWDTVASRWRITAGSQDHGRLSGLTDDDHTQYIRVDGTRAFTGSQSMGGNDLTNVDDITMGGATSIISAVGEINMSAAGIISSVAQLTMTAGSLIECNNGDITEWTDLTANGSGSTLSMAGGRIINVAYQEFDSSLSGAGTPGSATSMFMGTYQGLPRYRLGKNALWDFIAFEEHDEATDLSTSLSDVTINFASIDGKNLTDGVFFIEGWAFVVDNDSGSDSYWEWRIWRLSFVSGASTSATISERLFDGVAFAMDSRGPVYGSVTVSGQVVTMTRNHIFGGGTAKIWHVIRVRGLGGT